MEFFSPDTIRFLHELRENNNREWFASNRGDYERYLMAPARDMVFALGEALKLKSPDLVADPRVDRSIYRMNRDTRFSHDKTPYKDHLAMWLWVGPNRLEGSGFYLHLTPEGWLTSVGVYRFSDLALKNYLKVLADPKKSKTFLDIVAKVEKKGYRFNPPHLKRTPAAFPVKDGPASPWSRYRGLYTWTEDLKPYTGDFFSSAVIDLIMADYSDCFDLHKFLVSLQS